MRRAGLSAAAETLVSKVFKAFMIHRRNISVRRNGQTNGTTGQTENNATDLPNLLPRKWTTGNRNPRELPSVTSVGQLRREGSERSRSLRSLSSLLGRSCSTLLRTSSLAWRRPGWRAVIGWCSRPRDVWRANATFPPRRDCSNAQAARWRLSLSTAARCGHSADVSSTLQCTPHPVRLKRNFYEKLTSTSHTSIHTNKFI